MLIFVGILLFFHFVRTGIWTVYEASVRHPDPFSVIINSVISLSTLIGFVWVCIQLFGN